MNLQLTKTLLFAALTTAALTASAQHHITYWDYVITTAGDSIHCNVTMPMMAMPKYQSQAMKFRETITVEKIKEYSYYFYKQKYRAVYIDGDSTIQHVFLRVIEDGKIRIYQQIVYINGMAATSEINWYIGKNTDTVKMLIVDGIFTGHRKERINAFGEMIKDNPEVYNQFMAEDKFTSKQIQRIAHLYNTGHPLK